MKNIKNNAGVDIQRFTFRFVVFKDTLTPFVTK